MKRKILLTLLMFAALTQGCKKNLDLPPVGIVQDQDIFTNTSGITAYMARVYSEMPLEDFKYSPANGFNAGYSGSPAAITGEAISRDQQNATENQGAANMANLWPNAYALIRECNYFSETLPSYASNFSTTQVTNWLGEVRFIRAMAYFALVKRYGGVPLVDKSLVKPGQTISDILAEVVDLQIPRSSEQAVYDFIAADLDYAFANLPDAPQQRGRVSKWAALALKSRIMLYAASIAKYNTISLVNGSAQVCGVPASKAVDYYKASYDAATQVIASNKYALYKNAWTATDRNAQYQNFVNLFFDASSTENVFVRLYHYPDVVHSYDANQLPRQTQGATSGTGSETCPTLNFIEMYDGLTKNADGTLQTLDASGNYLLFGGLYDPFANAEPRLRATVILPNDIFKNQNIEFRRGIFTGAATSNIPKLVAPGSTSAYPTANIAQSATSDAQIVVTLPNGVKMNAAGQSGYFTSYSANPGVGSISGFCVRKYLVPDKPSSESVANHSDQTWIEMRYAEVLLTQAEAAYELNNAGQTGTYMATVLTDINLIRERAGATLATAADLTSVDIVRKERRKELAFENKTWWDLKRWRIIDKEQNGTIYRILNPFYAAQAGKYFFDDRFDERNSRYTFDTRWYYEQIPAAVIAKSNNIVQNPGY